MCHHTQTKRTKEALFIGLLKTHGTELGGNVQGSALTKSNSISKISLSHLACHLDSSSVIFWNWHRKRGKKGLPYSVREEGKVRAQWVQGENVHITCPNTRGTLREEGASFHPGPLESLLLPKNTLTITSFWTTKGYPRKSETTPINDNSNSFREEVRNLNTCINYARDTISL